MLKLVLVSVVLVACTKEKPVEQQSAASIEAHQIFDSLCSTCHGASGQGDGPNAKNLDPKPRNYTDKAWQASITDGQIRETIVKGGAAMGKSPSMPPSPQLESRPDVVIELTKLVRSFGE